MGKHSLSFLYAFSKYYMVRVTLYVSVLFLGWNIRSLNEKSSVKEWVKVNHVARGKLNKLILCPLAERLQYETSLFGLVRCFVPTNMHVPLSVTWATRITRSHKCRKSCNSKYSFNKYCLVTYSCQTLSPPSWQLATLHVALQVALPTSVPKWRDVEQSSSLTLGGNAT